VTLERAIAATTGFMSFDARHEQRKRLLDRIILAGQVVAVLYLATHALIAWRAFAIDGVAAALLTFVLLGFGDLYWGLRWAHEGEDRWIAGLALAAAALCFVSWATRGMFNRWAMKFTATMLEDFGSELGKMRQDTDRDTEADKPKDAPGEDDDGRPGGGARPPE
jgi:hypothetical protein